MPTFAVHETLQPATSTTALAASIMPSHARRIRSVPETRGEDPERVATQPGRAAALANAFDLRHEVALTQARSHTLDHPTQILIAAADAKHLVHALEPHEIEAQHPDDAPGSLSSDQRVRQHLGGASPIRKSGQRIMTQRES